jgi:hypothetical protein
MEEQLEEFLMEEKLEEFPDSADDCLNFSNETVQIVKSPMHGHAPESTSTLGSMVGDEELARLNLELGDEELSRLNLELITIKANILSRWTALLAPNVHSKGNSSSVAESSLTLDVQSQDVVPGKAQSQDVVPEKPFTNADSAPDPQSRRISNRKTNKRIPYVSGSGGGLTTKDHNPARVRKPVHQRWFYDLVPAPLTPLGESNVPQTDEISMLTGRVAKRMTLHEGSLRGDLSLARMPVHGEFNEKDGDFTVKDFSISGEEEYTINDPLSKLTHMPTLSFSFMGFRPSPGSV